MQVGKYKFGSNCHRYIFTAIGGAAARLKQSVNSWERRRLPIMWKGKRAFCLERSFPGKMHFYSEAFCREGQQVQFALHACFAQVQDLRPREEGGRALSVSKPPWQDTDIVSDYIGE